MQCGDKVQVTRLRDKGFQVTSILFFGLLIGMQHALEADHIAAVSSMVSREKSLRGMVQHGAFWGIGHAVILMMFAGAVIGFGLAISDQLATRLELAVGVMLVGLGVHVIYRLIRERIHFHAHRHSDDVLHVHVHAHSHAGESRRHEYSPHDHKHAKRLPIRTLLVGMMHGLAGSAALVVLATSTVHDPVTGIIYIALFGLGSILGMAFLSAVIAVPLGVSARFLTWANRGLQCGVGVLTIGLGVVVIVRSAQAAGF